MGPSPQVKPFDAQLDGRPQPLSDARSGVSVAVASASTAQPATSAVQRVEAPSAANQVSQVAVGVTEPNVSRAQSVRQHVTPTAGLADSRDANAAGSIAHESDVSNSARQAILLGASVGSQQAPGSAALDSALPYVVVSTMIALLAAST